MPAFRVDYSALGIPRRRLVEALLLGGILPAAFAIAMGVLVGAVQRGDPLAGPLAFAGAIFVLLQVLSPIHQVVSANLGDRTAASLYDRLTEACVRPPGMGHLEAPTLTSDLTVARDFDCRDDRPASVDLHGFHRDRHGRDDRRCRVRSDPRQIRLDQSLLGHTSAPTMLSTHAPDDVKLAALEMVSRVCSRMFPIWGTASRRRKC